MMKMCVPTILAIAILASAYILITTHLAPMRMPAPTTTCATMVFVQLEILQIVTMATFVPMILAMLILESVHILPTTLLVRTVTPAQ
jgi:hypothetical protein